MAQQDSEAEEKRRQFDCNSTYAEGEPYRCVFAAVICATALSPCLAVGANLRDKKPKQPGRPIPEPTQAMPRGNGDGPNIANIENPTVTCCRSSPTSPARNYTSHMHGTWFHRSTIVYTIRT